MRTINVSFEYDGKKINLKAVTNDWCTKLTKHKCNANVEFYAECGMWFMYFHCDGNFDYEVRGGWDLHHDGSSAKYLDYVAPWNKKEETWEPGIYEVKNTFPVQFR